MLGTVQTEKRMGGTVWRARMPGSANRSVCASWRAREVDAVADLAMMRGAPSRDAVRGVMEAMINAPVVDKTCWAKTASCVWDLDIYEKYDYVSGTGFKPVAHQACRDVFQLLQGRLQMRGATGYTLRKKAPFAKVTPFSF